MPFDHAAEPETEDPRATLEAKSIHERCSAARDLSRYGTPDDIPLLVKVAQDDRSPSVRLGAAGAAADILSRYRLGDVAAQLSTEQRRDFFEHFKGMDPDINPGLFSLLACIGLPEGFKRIAVGLRDPRGDVRKGAAIGLLRLCSSAAAQGDAALEAAVVEILRDPRMKPDALAEVAWVAARAGFRTARSTVDSLVLDGSHGELVAQARELLRSYEEPLSGAFYTDGRDAGEVNPTPPHPGGFAVFGSQGAMMGDGDEIAGWSYLDGLLPGGIRRMHLRPLGQLEPGPAFQLEGRTWYAADEARLVAVAEAIARPEELDWSALGAASPLEEHAAAVLDEFLADDPAGQMLRGLLRARAGDLAGAIELLQASAAVKKKMPRDAPWFLGQALLAAGQAKAGKDQLRAWLKKARKKDTRRDAAEALISG